MKYLCYLKNKHNKINNMNEDRKIKIIEKETKESEGSGK
jgi:hypothetical protein